MTPDELMERCEQFLRDNTGNLYIDGNNDPDEESVALLESLCREMIAEGLERAAVEVSFHAYAKDHAIWCRKEAQRVKEGKS